LPDWVVTFVNFFKLVAAVELANAFNELEDVDEHHVLRLQTNLLKKTIYAHSTFPNRGVVTCEIETVFGKRKFHSIQRPMADPCQKFAESVSLLCNTFWSYVLMRDCLSMLRYVLQDIQVLLTLKALFGPGLPACSLVGLLVI